MRCHVLPWLFSCLRHPCLAHPYVITILGRIRIERAAHRLTERLLDVFL